MPYDPEPWEVSAILYAGQQAGEYLTEIQKTDLAQFTPDEWQILLTVICQNYQEKHRELQPCPF